MNRQTTTQKAAATAPPAPSATPAGAATPATAAVNPAATAPAAATPATTTQASNTGQGIEKPGKREKIRFGQAPRESLPASQVATANAPDNGPGVTTPESRVINPDGTLSGASAPVQERKTRFSQRPSVKKTKQEKAAANAVPAATPDELASQKVQNAPLGLTDPNAQKKAKEKAEKTRLEDKQKQEDQTKPYLGEPANPSGSVPSSSAPADSTTHPDAPKNPPAPATGPPDPIPPGAQQP